MAPNSFQYDDSLKKIQGRYSPASVLLITIVGIAVAETIAMLVVYFFRDLPYPQQILLDAVVMTVIIFPLLYLLSFRPLLQHIDQRWRAEKQVREMALFPTLNPDAVLQVDATGRITKCNPIAEQMGLSVDTVLFDLVPDLRDLNLAECIAFGTTLQVYETRMGERFLQWRVRGDAELGFAFLYSQDITERKRGEEAIKLLSSIVEQTADTVVVTDRDGVIEYINPAVEDTTGYAREEILDKNPRVFKSGAHDGRFYGELWDTILRGEVFHGEITNRKKNGELIHEVKTITPLRDAEGNITRFVATGKDITERKLAEEKLRHAYDELEIRVQERTAELVVANAALMEEINERKKVQSALEESERELRESEEKAQNLVRYAPAAIYEMDIFGRRLISVNDVACQWSGYSRDEMLTLNPMNLMDEESRVKFQRKVQEKIRGEDINEAVEYKIIAKDGHAIVAEMHVGAFTYKDGNLESVLVVAHDITARKQAEEELRQSREDLFRAQQVGQIGSWRLDVRTNILKWSEENHHIFGIPLGTPLTYETFLDAIHPDDREYVNAKWEASLAGEPYDIEHRIVVKGEVKWVREKAYLELDEAGNLLGGFGISQDITERKRAEEQLQYQATLLSNVNDAIVASDAQFRLTAWNAAAESLYGWKSEEILGRVGVDILRTEWGEKDANEMRRIIAETGRWRGEAIQARKDGTRFPVEVSSIVLYDERDQVAGYVSVNRDITARKQADEALRQSEEQFYKVFHFSPVGANLFRLADGCSVDVNDAFLELTGYSREEFIGHSGLELNLFPDPDDRTKWMQGVLENGVVRNIDSRIRRKSGQIANVLFSIVRTEINGEMMGLVMVIDITERRMAEEVLRRAHDELELRVRERTKELSDEIAERKEIERQLRIETTALEAAADGVIITDTTGSILWANPAFLNMSGYDMDEVIGSTPHILSSGMQDQAYYRELWRTILEGNTWRGETVNRRKDGSLYVEEQTITPVRLEGGQLSHFIAIKQDVTERKHAEDALRESEEKFRTLVEWTYDWEIWLDPMGNIIYNSPSCERITGYSPEEFLSSPDLMTRIIHPEDRSFFEAHQKTLHDATAGVEKVEYRIVARNRREHWIEHICRPLFGVENRYLGRRISNRDISEQKQVEEKIRERNRKEKLLLQTIHTMQLDIARDLHDTIGQNIGYLRMKLDHMVEKDIPAKGDDLRAEFSQMLQVANESYELVRGTLAILQSQGSDDLLQLFKRYTGQIVERSGLKIEFTDQGKAEFVTIHQMRQLFYIFREALSNIEKHSGASHTWVDMKWSATWVELSIRDNGKGFDPSQKMAGHYGLKFMRERTEMMKGSFQVKTGNDGGTHIIIGVPLHGGESENEIQSISYQEGKK